MTDDKSSNDTSNGTSAAARGIGLGSVVQLNSGGPGMTVGRITCAKAGPEGPEVEMLECHWIDDSGAPQIADFPAACVGR
jgi:uncharacterized protein YodC (DUF2158 family)